MSIKVLHLHDGGPQRPRSRLNCLVSGRLAGGVDDFSRAVGFRGRLTDFVSVIGDRVRCLLCRVECFDYAGSASVAAALGLGFFAAHVLARWQWLLVLKCVVWPAGQELRAAAEHQPVQAHDKPHPAAQVLLSHAWLVYAHSVAWGELGLLAGADDCA